jgi:hypothetical protein
VTATRTLALLILMLGGACYRGIPSGSNEERVGTRVTCSGVADTDRDDLADDCELKLASAFAPYFVVSTRACNWDASVQNGRIGGEYYFAVQRTDSGEVRIAYLPAYYEDCGWEGIKCHQPVIPCEGHSGDSEFVAIDVVRAGDNVWRTERVFLSAHCFDTLDQDCRWYSGPDLDRFDWEGGRYAAPVIWVAEGKGANYPSRSDCDRGHLFYDTCDRNDVRQRYAIVSQAQNIGSPMSPAGEAGGCVSWKHTGIVSAKVAPGTYECFWKAAAAFRGWQQPARGSATPYDRYLREITRF